MAVRVPAFLCLLFAVSGAQADYIPGIGPAPIYYFSTATDELKISLAEPSAPEKSPEIVVIPRAYVVFADIKRPGANTPLPQEFTTKSINIAFVAGTGEAWNVAVAERARRDGITPKEAGELLRPQLVLMHLYLRLRPDRTQSYADFKRKHVVPVPETFEGLIPYRNQNISSFHYYFGEKKDRFTVAQCHGPEGKSNLSCKYTSDISDAIYADLSFADFRFYGGREFANKRIDAARGVACRFLPDC